MLHLASLALLTALPAIPQAPPQAPGTPALTLERIMADPEWIGRPPERPFWSPGGAEVYFWREREGGDVDELWRVAGGGEPQRVTADERAGVAMPRGDWSADRRRYVFERNGDLFVLDADGGALRQLTRTTARESAPRFMAGDGAVFFQRDGAGFAFELEDGLVRQLADVRAADDPDEEEGDFDYLEAKQERLYGELRVREAIEEERRAHERELEAADPTRAPRPWYLGEGLDVSFESYSPDGRWLVVVTEKEGGGGERGTMPTYVTDSGYVETRSVRRRVGRDGPRGQSLHLLDLVERTRREVAFDGLPGVADDPFAELRPAAIEWHVEHGAEREEVERELKAPEQRALRVQDIEWTDDGAGCLVRFDSVDNKDRWLATLDFDAGQLVPQHRLHDPAWINWRFNEFGWLPGGDAFWFLSEEDGFSQVWTKALGGAAVRRTEGGYVARDPELSPDGRWLYFRGNASDPAVWEVYRVGLDGGGTERITNLGGENEFGLSPDGGRIWVLHSEMQRHADLFVQDAEPGAVAVRLTDTVSAEFAAFPWSRPDIVDIPSSHVERPLRARLYRPRDFDPARRWPAVVFVHGAGYLQNVTAGWSGYFREFLFHSLLTEHGYVVLDLDYRGSAGYGRDWRTAVYRRMGHPEVEDLRDAVDWLATEVAVDRARIGVYGGSYGGFLTFMALFREPDLFAAGAALRPVTDWAHYNHGYTSNILNTPLVDPVAFERSSPIEFAEGLTKPLLICAGMQDDNVFFQDTVLLVQRLLELKKESFETAFYPLEPHSFRRPESWLDEYRRIFELFERTLAQ